MFIDGNLYCFTPARVSIFLYRFNQIRNPLRIVGKEVHTAMEQKLRFLNKHVGKRPCPKKCRSMQCGFLWLCIILLLTALSTMALDAESATQTAKVGYFCFPGYQKV